MDSYGKSQIDVTFEDKTFVDQHSVFLFNNKLY